MINEVLRLLRIANDCSVNELSTKTGISASYIREIERGEKKPSEKTIDKYAKALDIDKMAINFFAAESDKTTSNYQKLLLQILSKIVAENK